MTKIVQIVAPKSWWHWPVGIAFWGAVTAVIVYIVEWFWKPSAMGAPLEHYIVTTIMAAPLLLAGLALLAHMDRLHTELAKLAATDPLTNLMNRRAFLTALEQAGPGALLMIDLDYFKSVNDSYGHITGDKVLLLMAARLRDSLRKDDLVGRLGGEEFAVFLQDAGADGMKVWGHDISSGVRYKDDNVQFVVTASVGGVIMQADDHVLHALNKADQALYQAKDAGRARFQAYVAESRASSRKKSG
ncbi:GGDEF domain-containing protein [Cognatiyoonia sp. IB215182]|uniref:GGDEF domain-containing protein n=1 Tax=Cognatiyoonia sp. IB215182 TaxID=3097353 RepID=UPI002A15B491|nr:GGDEF domain-containing protein [Cognatiyoonia sp. IB215182]MDX8352184.1 GGDEF domain-containing protein [Cognatiyoonia sp. IB215182]